MYNGVNDRGRDAHEGEAVGHCEGRAARVLSEPQERKREKTDDKYTGL
jgi:hypothetical protein